MKNLTFQELLLVSTLEKRAKRIKFHPIATVIRGKNDTGKSSVLKSLYWCLGAEPQNIHERWKSAKVTASLKFSIDNQSFRLIRQDKRFSLFDSNDNWMRNFSSVTKELSPYFAEEFNFHIVLQSREQETQATPAFLFLPFYIDQDQGWYRILNSFDRLEQFQNWKQDVVDFHLGIKPSEFYTEKAKLKGLESEFGELERSRAGLEGILDGVRKRLKESSFDVDVEIFRDEIEALLTKCSRLQKVEERYRRKLSDCFERKASLAEQLDITKAALNELQADRRFAADELADVLICPTCHATYDNSFVQRFEIALDEDGCLEMLSELEGSLRAAELEWTELQGELKTAASETKEIEELLAVKRNKVTLAQLIRREGQKDVSSSIKKDIDQISGELRELEKAIEESKTLMKSISDKKRVKIIKDFYKKRLLSLFIELRLANLDSKVANRTVPSIKETGNALPRAILAYFLAILQTIEEFGSSTLCPVVIDSPKQQDPDARNWKAVLKCIAECTENRQLIIGLVDNDEETFGGKVIEFSTVDNVLNQKEFQKANEELLPLIRESLA